MTFGECKKRYTRFLKEMGVYRKVINVYNGHERYNKYPYILTTTSHPSFWIQSSSIFCTWAGTSEGDIFWWAISLLWQCECIENNIVFDYGYKYIIPSADALVRDLERYITYYKQSIDENGNTLSSIDTDILKKNMEKIAKKLNTLTKIK